MTIQGGHSLRQCSYHGLIEYRLRVAIKAHGPLDCRTEWQPKNKALEPEPHQ